MKNLERYCPKYIYLRLHVKCLLVCSILTKLNLSTNLGKNSLCKISSKPLYLVPNSSLRMVRGSYRRADITNLLVDFRSCLAIWSKIWCCYVSILPYVLIVGVSQSLPHFKTPRIKYFSYDKRIYKLLLWEWISIACLLMLYRLLDNSWMIVWTHHLFMNAFGSRTLTQILHKWLAVRHTPITTMFFNRT